MVSAIDSAKRVLVALLKSIAAVYSLTLSLTRESTDAEIQSAFRKVSKKAHPDHGGKKEHQAALNTARDTWEDATKAGKEKHGGERRDGPLLPTQARRQNDALGVLLTPKGGPCAFIFDPGPEMPSGFRMFSFWAQVCRSSSTPMRTKSKPNSF